MPNRNLPNMLPRFVGAIFGLVFFGIGFSLLLFGGMGMQLPIIFHLVRSFIAISFMAVGGSTAYMAITGKSRFSPVSKILETHLSADFSIDKQEENPDDESTKESTDYRCKQCGAWLKDDVDVSPSGDVKCNYCRSWFNIHS